MIKKLGKEEANKTLLTRCSQQEMRIKQVQNMPPIVHIKGIIM